MGVPVRRGRFVADGERSAHGDMLIPMHMRYRVDRRSAIVIKSCSQRILWTAHFPPLVRFFYITADTFFEDLPQIPIKKKQID